MVPRRIESTTATVVNRTTILVLRPRATGRRDANALSLIPGTGPRWEGRDGIPDRAPFVSGAVRKGPTRPSCGDDECGRRPPGRPRSSHNPRPLSAIDPSTG